MANKNIFKFPVAIIDNMKRDEKSNSDILKITMLVEEGFPESQLIIHHFKLDDFINAYETFQNAAREKALKVMIRLYQVKALKEHVNINNCIGYNGNYSL